MDEIDFDAAFEALTGNLPFPWQRALYVRFISDRGDNIPASCNLPTGLGKTSVIAVWLIALAYYREKMPRRLVYVVNRRTVVDQTTDEVVKYRRKLSGEDAGNAAILSDLAERLCKLSATGVPLAISTLRGQFADNREWSADPARPAVICGTVDMIGSRLLFSGYGCGFKTRPLHAGFLGQDALIVHDEAHLEPAFQKLLLAIECEQTGGRMNERGECENGDKPRDFCPLKVMELTATSRADAVSPFELTAEDYKHKKVQDRINATKKLHLHPLEKKLADDILKYAVDLTAGERSNDKAILIFVREVKVVEEIVKKLPKGQTQQLTGTLRGLERDELPRDPVFVRFLPESNRPDGVELAKGTVYLVCTSAGEVGVNISADHLVCDLSTFESMAQRFGRVNRFGYRTDSEIHVVHPKEADFESNDEMDLRFCRTLELLWWLLGDASPASLGRLSPAARQAAFAPPPVVLSTSGILFDAWALTTINKPLVKQKLPGRPLVGPYLHGVAEWQPLETHLAWRDEVELVTGKLLAEHEPEALLDAYPLKPHEQLRDNSVRVFDRLKKLKAKADTPVWLVSEDDSVKITTLGDLIDAGKEEIERKIVLLPPRAGGLENGFLTSESSHADDVADKWYSDATKTVRRRCRVWDDDDVPDAMRRILTIDTNPDADESDEERTGRRFWHWYELRYGGDDEGIQNSKKPVLWQVHTSDVVRNMTDIVERLLPDNLRELFVLAAKCHDLGKKRKLFQTVLGNSNYPTVELAKSGKNGGRVEERYRHEFGSLLDIQAETAFNAIPDDDLKALVLHVIAAHHGRGRPHFPTDEVFDPEPKGCDANVVAREVPQRFARLQRKYGRWGLAYLESLLRSADYAASACPSEFVVEGRK